MPLDVFFKVNVGWMATDDDVASHTSSIGNGFSPTITFTYHIGFRLGDLMEIRDALQRIDKKKSEKKVASDNSQQKTIAIDWEQALAQINAI